MEQAKNQDIILIKKYANRRLYNTHTSTYINQKELADLLRTHANIHIVEARTHKDITRDILAQTLIEADAKNAPMLSTAALRQLLQLHGSPWQALAPLYLELALDIFMKNQKYIQTQTDDLLGSYSPFHPKSMPHSQKDIEAMQETLAGLNPFFHCPKDV